MAPDETQVLAVNQAFYDAVVTGNIEALDALWVERADVTCIHPGWDALIGRDEVMASFRAIFSGGGAPRIQCVDATARLFGETAIVVCGEVLDGTYLIATNVFVREGAGWRLCHHQAGPVSVRRRTPTPPSDPGMLN